MIGEDRPPLLRCEMRGSCTDGCKASKMTVYMQPCLSPPLSPLSCVALGEACAIVLRCASISSPLPPPPPPLFPPLPSRPLPPALFSHATPATHTSRLPPSCLQSSHMQPLPCTLLLGEACTIALRGASTCFPSSPQQLPPVFQILLTAFSLYFAPVRCGVGRGVHHRAARRKHTHPGRGGSLPARRTLRVAGGAGCGVIMWGCSKSAG